MWIESKVEEWDRHGGWWGRHRGQAGTVVRQALWSGPEENLFMTNSAVSSIFLAIILPHCFLFLLNLHTLTSRCCVYI